MTPDNFQGILNVIALALIVSIIWGMWGGDDGCI